MSAQSLGSTLPWTCLLAALLAIDSAAAQVVNPAGAPQLSGTVLISGVRVPKIIDPPSGEEQIGFAHTNIKVLVPRAAFPNVPNPAVGPPFAGYLFETPASLACIYRLVTVSSGCNPNVVKVSASGGSYAIAIVDAYDYPKATSDLNTYVAQFGLATANFQVVYGTGNPANGCMSGTKPMNGSGSGWDLEAALDIEIAHAMAPGAKIYLVEARSNSNADLFNAVAVATRCVQASGAGEQSNSWGESEFSGETAYDSYFGGTNVTYFASAGDQPGVLYPAASANVIGVGGTTISRDRNTGAFQSEAVWNDAYAGLGTGGGPSRYEALPNYQQAIAAVVGNSRGTPDIAGIADPLTGVWVYNTTYLRGWGGVGGTSVAAPLGAAITNQMNLLWSSSYGALVSIYQSQTRPNITNIYSGVCGPGKSAAYPHAYGEGYDPQYMETSSSILWNWCTGWGTLRGPN